MQGLVAWGWGGAKGRDWGSVLKEDRPYCDCFQKSFKGPALERGGDVGYRGNQEKHLHPSSDYSVGVRGQFKSNYFQHTGKVEASKPNNETNSKLDPYSLCNNGGVCTVVLLG